MQRPAWHRLCVTDLWIDVEMMMCQRGVTWRADVEVVNRTAILVADELVVDATATAQMAVVAEQLNMREQIQVADHKQNQRQDKSGEDFH